jgi:hypothetical protein
MRAKHCQNLDAFSSNQDGNKSLNCSPNFTSIAPAGRNRTGKTASRRARLRNNRQHWLQSRKHGVYRNLWRSSHSSAFGVFLL